MECAKQYGWLPYAGIDSSKSRTTEGWKNNEKNHYIYNNINDTNSLHNAVGPDTQAYRDGYLSGKYAESSLGFLRAEWK